MFLTFGALKNLIQDLGQFQVSYNLSVPINSGSHIRSWAIIKSRAVTTLSSGLTFASKLPMKDLPGTAEKTYVIISMIETLPFDSIPAPSLNFVHSKRSARVMTPLNRCYSSITNIPLQLIRLQNVDDCFEGLFLLTTSACHFTN